MCGSDSVPFSNTKSRIKFMNASAIPPCKSFFDVILVFGRANAEKQTQKSKRRREKNMTKHKIQAQLPIPQYKFFFGFFCSFQVFFLSHWDITAPFDLKIWIFKETAEEFGNHRPA